MLDFSVPAQTDAYPSDARERILSEDMVSIIYHFETMPFRGDQIPAYYLPQKADWQYTILNAPLSEYGPDIAHMGYFTIPKLYTLLDERALNISGFYNVFNQPYLSYTGKDVIIGFIDTGIDYELPYFRFPDGTSRILSIWDQTIQSGTPPEGFLYGSEYTKDAIDRALISQEPLKQVPSIDEIGHGTAMALTACGSRQISSNFSGAAPDSDILVVKLKPAKQYLRNYFLVKKDAVCYQEDDCMLAVRYLKEQAKKQKKSLVLCFGLGTNQGGHDGLTPFDDVLSYLTYTVGQYACVAGGNETGCGHHYSAILSENETEHISEIVVEKSGTGFTAELWTSAPNLFAIGVISPLGERISPIDPRIGASHTTTLLLERTVVDIDYEILEARSGNQLIQIRIENASRGNWQLQIIMKQYFNGRFDLWLPITGIASPDVRFLTPDPDTTLTVPSCNEHVVTVSGYDAASLAIYPNSSRGFTRNDKIKPDLAAPAVSLYVPAAAGYPSSFTGTSAAAAVTAGAEAVLLQWAWENYQKILSPTEMKNLLYRGTVRFKDLYYPNREWGYGTLNVYQIFSSLS